MVTTLVPIGAVAVAERIREELPIAGFGEKLAVTPVGSPETDKLMAPRKPYDSEIGIALLTVAP